MAHSKELGSDYAVGLDLGRGGIEPVLHGKGVGPGATAADEEDVGITLLADLIHGLVNLGTKGECIADNLLITRNIKVEHGISSFICAALPLNPPPCFFLCSGGLFVVCMLRNITYRCQSCNTISSANGVHYSYQRIYLHISFVSTCRKRYIVAKHRKT